MTVASSSMKSIRYSLKRFLLDITKNRNIPIVFDRSLAEPNLRDGHLDKWIVPVYGITRYMENAVQIELNINICTRRDPEWDKNMSLLDHIKSQFEKAKASGEVAIPLFSGKEQVGCITVLEITMRNGYDLEDQTKITPMSIMLWCPIAY